MANMSRACHVSVARLDVSMNNIKKSDQLVETEYVL